MQTGKWRTLVQRLYLSRRDTAVTMGILLGVSLLCLALWQMDPKGHYVAELYLLAVFLISRFTTGFFYGIAASCLCVLAVNYFFTFPYFAFNFTISGYPLTILCMLAVSVATSAMTTQIKRQGSLRVEAEREKTRSNLLRAVSHDLRTPLTSILGASSALADDDGRLTEPERRQLAREIGEDAQWLIRMVENLLSVTRMDDGTSEARLQKQVEVAEEVVSAAVDRLHKRFPQQDVTVSVPDELLMVAMDAMLIEQVLINLLENAILHGKTATHIDLILERRGELAVFRVEDDGCGMEPAILDRLFEQSIPHDDRERSDSRRSLGIGLSVCNTIIRAHGGRMTAYNRPKGGAAVEFTLPLEDETV